MPRTFQVRCDLPVPLLQRLSVLQHVSDPRQHPPPSLKLRLFGTRPLSGTVCNERTLVEGRAWWGVSSTGWRRRDGASRLPNVLDVVVAVVVRLTRALVLIARLGVGRDEVLLLEDGCSRWCETARSTSRDVNTIETWRASLRLIRR